MKKSVRFSLRKKAVLMIIVMAVILSGSGIAVSGYVFSRNNDERYRAKASELAATVRAVADTGSVCELQREVAAIYDATENKVGSEHMGTPEYEEYMTRFSHIEQGEAFKHLYGQLRGIQDANDVESIYILYVDVQTRATVYMVDVSDDPCLPGNFDPVYEQNEAVLTDPTVGFPPYITNTEEYGWLVSAAVPIMAEDGTVVAYAFADISMNDVKNAERSFLITLSALLIGLTALICVAFIVTTNRSMIRPLNKLSDAASHYYDNKSNTAQRDSFSKLDVSTGDEIEQLSTAMKQMETDMNEYIRDLTAVTAEKERIGAELNVATQIQADMLPRIFPPFPDRNEFDIYASMNPAKEVGGDFYDFFLIDDNQLGMVMADVSGKGVPAALFMVIAKTLIKNRAQMGGGPAEILNYVNEQLCEGNDAELFVTVWFAILDIKTGKGLAANAGHEHPALRRANGEFELVIYRHSPAVAVMDGMRFKEHEFELKPGDSLFVYTDGVTEATDARNELFGTDRMVQALNRNPDAAPKELLENVRKDIDTFVGEAPQFDDITMLALHYSGSEG